VFHIIAHVLSIGGADPTVPLPDTGASTLEQDWNDATVALVACCCVVGGLVLGVYMSRFIKIPEAPSMRADPEAQRLLPSPRAGRAAVAGPISGEI